MHEITLDRVCLTVDPSKRLQVLWAWVDSGDQRLSDERLNILKGLAHLQQIRAPLQLRRTRARLNPSEAARVIASPLASDATGQ